MNITLSLDDELIRTARKLAVERDTTLTGLIRTYLERLAADDAASGRKHRDRETLMRSFRELEFRTGKPTWERADLYERG